MSTIHCESLDKYLGQTDEPKSHLGEVSIKWLLERAGDGTLETGAREYQREQVAPTEWKQGLMHTILCNPYARIPQIHVRVIKAPARFKYEIIDGQQRTTGILDFLRGEYSLPASLKSYDDRRLDGMNVEKLETLPSVFNLIMNYRITVIWYENLDDAMVSQLFVKVLNNQNNLNPQEKRNALRGEISAFIRNNSRFDVHKLFTRVRDGKKDEKLKFIPALKLKGRMEVDEWLTKLLYMYENPKGFRDGISGQKALSSWVEDAQLPTGFAALNSTSFNKYRKKWNSLLDFGYEMITAIPKDYMHMLTPMNAQVFILYAAELEASGQRIRDRRAFAESFFKTIKRWSDQNLKLYSRWTQLDGRQMPPMKELFGGLNRNAVGSICWIFDKVRKEENLDWGTVELDPRDSFSRDDIVRKWLEQDKKCYYTGRLLDEEELVGDHYIPRSFGIAAGGVTEYTNLVITDRHINGRKLNTHGDEFVRLVKEEQVA